jgi:hypothetical protein
MVIFKCPFCRTDYEMMTARLSLQHLRYTSISLSHLSLLMVGIRACKAMGEIRFAGSFLHDNPYHNTIIADN